MIFLDWRRSTRTRSNRQATANPIKRLHVSGRQRLHNIDDICQWWSQLDHHVVATRYRSSWPSASSTCITTPKSTLLSNSSSCCSCSLWWPSRSRHTKVTIKSQYFNWLSSSSLCSPHTMKPPATSSSSTANVWDSPQLLLDLLLKAEEKIKSIRDSVIQETGKVEYTTRHEPVNI